MTPPLPQRTPDSYAEICEAVGDSEIPDDFPEKEIVTLDRIPPYAGKAHIAINNNIPFFTEDEQTTEPFERYSE